MTRSRNFGLLNVAASRTNRCHFALVRPLRESVIATRRPVGVAALIVSFNTPLPNYAWKVFPAVLCGNAAVLKPSEYTPACGELLREMVHATFDRDRVDVVVGGLELARAFTRVRWDHLLDVLLTGPCLLAQRCAREMVRTDGGSIVNITSFLGHVTDGPYATYGVAKAGLIALTRALAEEGAPLGIRANCIAPDTLRTPQNAAAMPSADPSHWVSLEDAAAAIALLCSPACAANGSVLLVPG